MSELLLGVHRSTGAHRVRRRAMVEATLARFAVIDITRPVAQVHAELRAELERTGQRIGDHDLWIGATAITRNFGVFTLDTGDFQRVPGLRVTAP